MSYLTAGEQEVRAWTIAKGTKAPQAAGKIHSDFERGFIRAEVVSYDDLMACGSMAAAREKGLVRSEGKDYVMQDGDVVLFRSTCKQTPFAVRLRQSWKYTFFCEQSGRGRGASPLFFVEMMTDWLL